MKLPEKVKLTPELPAEACTVNAIKTALPGITLIHEKVRIEPAKDWPSVFARYGLCFVAVVERHGKSAGNVAHGLLKDFGLKRGAVASSVGHDSHNIIVAGTNEPDMQVAIAAIKERQGGVCVVADGEVRALVPLPIAGLLSDKRVTAVADEVKALKTEWAEAGCTIPYMGFNLIPYRSFRKFASPTRVSCWCRRWSWRRCSSEPLSRIPASNRLSLPQNLHGCRIVENKIDLVEIGSRAIDDLAR